MNCWGKKLESLQRVLIAGDNASCGQQARDTCVKTVRMHRS